MGLFAKLFGLRVHCPQCGADWAKESLFSGVHCVSPNCKHYDRAHAENVFRQPFCAACPECGADWAELASFTDVKCTNPNCSHYDRAYASGGFANPVKIEYVNFEGQNKTFTCDADSLRIKGQHLAAAVAPTGRRIALKIEKIANRQDLVEAIRNANEANTAMPTPREKRVLSYHKRRGTTSPLYESLRTKHPSF